MPLPKVQLVQAAPSNVGRRLRTPRHNFAVTHDLFSIRPFFLAPVLPGETMKYLNVQASVQSGLMYPRMTGFWYEMYFFYVKHRDLAERDLLTDMHVKNVTDPSLLTAADPIHYHQLGINWSKLCMIRCVEEYFRNEGEAWDIATSSSGLPLASIENRDWLDSGFREGAVADEVGLPDQETMLDWMEQHEVPPGFEEHYAHWLTMKRSGLIPTDFEDYLKANGIRIPKEDVSPHRPELIRYIRDFTKPQRATSVLGEEAVHCKWDLNERADKDRLFKEPGFLIGLAVCRPKLYMKQSGAAAGLLSDAYSWLPALLNDNPETSIKEIPAAQTGELFGAADFAENVVVDMRDLFNYGEQYVAGVGNVEVTGTRWGPDANFGRRYVPPSFLTDWWFETAAASPPDYYSQPLNGFRAEGVVTLQIATRIPPDSVPGLAFNPGMV